MHHRGICFQETHCVNTQEQTAQQGWGGLWNSPGLPTASAWTPNRLPASHLPAHTLYVVTTSSPCPPPTIHLLRILTWLPATPRSLASKGQAAAHSS